MQEFKVMIETQDGTMPVEVFHPDIDRRYPGIIFYMDIYGLRDELRDMCRRYATAGYAVFMPSLFYRHGSPSFPPRNRIEDPADPAASQLNQATTTAMSSRDTTALIHFANPSTDLDIPVWGTVGYCMGGRHALAGAAANTRAVKAAVSLHGGQLINDTPDSIELLIERIDADVYFGFAQNDSSCPDDHQKLIADRLSTSTTQGRIDYYNAAHGWTFPERHVFDKGAADRAWENAFHIFRTRLWGAM